MHPGPKVKKEKSDLIHPTWKLHTTNGHPEIQKVSHKPGQNAPEIPGHADLTEGIQTERQNPGARRQQSSTAQTRRTLERPTQRGRQV